MENNDCIILSEIYNPRGFYINIDIEICKQNTESVEIFFEPNDSCEDDEKKLISKTKIEGSLAQRLLYNSLPYSRTKYHEGAIFGINYAFDVFKKETNFLSGLNVNILKIGDGTMTRHDIVAYLCAKMIWMALKFSPKKEITHDIINDKVSFPETTMLFPIGKVTINELQKYVDSIILTLMKKNNEEQEADLRKIILEYHKNRILNNIQEYFFVVSDSQI